MFLLLWQFSITGDSEGAWPKGGPEVTGRSDTQSVSEGRPRGGGGGGGVKVKRARRALVTLSR